MSNKDSEKRKEYQRTYFLKNKSRLYENSRINSKRLYREKIKWLREYKEKISCEKCGFNEPICLDFHHKNPNGKVERISAMANSLRPIKKIEEEINKCIVLCANCHRLEHQKLGMYGIKDRLD